VMVDSRRHLLKLSHHASSASLAPSPPRCLAVLKLDACVVDLLSKCCLGCKVLSVQD
jgi:hypothetical protein